MLCEEVKKLRKYLNLTQKEFGEELGVSQRAVSAWESGDNELTVPIINEIYHKWNISPNCMILGGTELNIAIDRLLELAKKEEEEKEILNILSNYINNKRLNSLESIIGSLKGNSFIEKLSEVCSGKGERMLIILHYFIEHLESKDIKEINKSNLKLLVSNFSIPTKIKMKHFFVIKKKDEILFKEWIESNFNDEDAKMLFENLSNAKVFIKEELNYLNRFWI